MLPFCHLGCCDGWMATAAAEHFQRRKMSYKSLQSEKHFLCVCLYGSVCTGLFSLCTFFREGDPGNL